jgi:hypothetical protein
MSDPVAGRRARTGILCVALAQLGRPLHRPGPSSRTSGSRDRGRRDRCLLRDLYLLRRRLVREVYQADDAAHRRVA